MSMDKKIAEYLDRVAVLEKRSDSESLSNLSAKQRKMYDEVELAYKNQPNAYLSRSGLQKLVASDLEDRDNFISDFTYDTVNKEDKPVKFMVKQGRKYRFVGVGFKPVNPIDVTWEIRLSGRKKFVVGRYSGSGYSWDFAEVREYLTLL